MLKAKDNHSHPQQKWLKEDASESKGRAKLCQATRGERVVTRELERILI